MQNSRDSSIWRSLAVAFGDGVAFGVGVKLAQGSTHTAAGASAAAPATLDSVSGRLEQIEQRLSTIEQSAMSALPAASAPAPFDQKVLEAVVNALDARLREQAGQVERRLTQLEAKLAIDLKNLDLQDKAIVTGLQKRLEEAHVQYNEHVTAIRDAVAQDMDMLYSQIARAREEFAGAAGESLETRIAAAVTAAVQSRMESVENRMQIHVLEAAERAGRQATSAAAGRLESQIVQLQSSLAEKAREIAELRQRITDADQSVLDLILAMGQMCRDVAARITPAAAAAESRPTAVPPPETPPEDTTGAPSQPESSAVPPAAPPPEGPSSEAFGAEPEAPVIAIGHVDGGTNGSGLLESPPEPLPPVSADEMMPELAPNERPSRLWRVPLVSGFLILAAGSLYMLH